VSLPPARSAPPRILLITDPAHEDDAIVRVVEAAVAALPHGTFAVQLRDKARPRASLAAFAARLRTVTRPGGAPRAQLVVNGDVEIARDVGADGVHLGTNASRVEAARRILGPHAFVSLAAHDDAELRAALDAGASAALVSPIFATPGKGTPRGVDALRSARSIVRDSPDGAGFAIYALGGVDEGNAAACIAAGADGVALIRALLLPRALGPVEDVVRAISTSITS
jgi:thiamine-phosphate pyrophosphorylase